MRKYWSFQIRIPNPIYFLWFKPRALKKIEKIYSIQKAKNGLYVVYNDKENYVITIPLTFVKAYNYKQTCIDLEKDWY